MNLGAMRHRVTIEAPPDAAPNALGEAPGGWLVVCECWAAVDTLSGRELYREAQVQADASHKVTVRFRAGIAGSMRVVCRGRFFNIYRVDNPGERDDELDLFCVEQKA